MNTQDTYVRARIDTVTRGNPNDFIPSRKSAEIVGVTPFSLYALAATEMEDTSSGGAPGRVRGK